MPNNTLLLGKRGHGPRWMGEGFVLHMLMLIHVSNDLCYLYPRMYVLDPELVGFSEFSLSGKRARI